MAMVIAGRTVTAQQGMTVLEVARGAGVDIPTLCHHDDVAPFGACRLCTVEIAKGGRSRLVASCCYPADEGLDVRTESERLTRGRKLILEMMLARAPGVQVLRDYASRYGAEADKFSELMLRETTAFGVRKTIAERRKLRREFAKVKTAFGEVTMKIGRLGGKVVQAAPEFESAKKLAAQAKVPVKRIYAAVGAEVTRLKQKKS